MTNETKKGQPPKDTKWCDKCKSWAPLDKLVQGKVKLDGTRSYFPLCKACKALDDARLLQSYNRVCTYCHEFKNHSCFRSSKAPECIVCEKRTHVINKTAAKALSMPW